MKTRFLLAAVFLLLPLAPAGARPVDIIRLKDGGSVEGKVLSEGPEGVVIQYEAAKGIMDQKSIPKADIASIERASPSALAFETVAKVLPTPDLLTVEEYDRLLAQVLEPFLADHASSPEAKEAKRILEAVREERERVARGDLKLGGEWIKADEYQKEKFWIDGRIALAGMEKAAKARDFRGAMARFHQIEKDYPGTSVIARAVAGARKVVAAYDAELADADRTRPALERQRQGRLATLTPNERQQTEEAWKRERETIKTRAADEAKAGAKWTVVDPADADQVKKARDALAKESARLAAIDTSALEKQERLLRDIDAALRDGRLEAAEALLKEAPQDIQRLPLFRALQERQRAESERVRAERAAAEKARLDATAAEEARLRREQAEKDRQEEEKAMQEAATNPVGRAVREVREGVDDESDRESGGFNRILVIAAIALGGLLLVLVAAPVLRRKKSKDDGPGAAPPPPPEQPSA